MRGRWLAGSIVAVVVAAIFAALGFWQLGRHHHKHDKMQAERAAFAAPAPDLAAITAPADGTRAQVSGTFDPNPAHETVLRDQLHNGDAGVDVLTPVRLADGTAVIVDRGWVALGSKIGAPPTGAVMVRGLTHESRPASTQSAVERDGPRLSMARVDLARIQADLPYGLRKVWLEAQYLRPAPGRDDPQLPEPPAPDQVNHLQYAIQWFAFALIPLIGWPIVVWRRGRKRQPA